MCRLALFNKKSYVKRGKNNILDLLNTLEKSCGGHGNGVAFITNNKVSFFKKGVKYANNEIVNDIFTQQPDWVIYHTRVSSAGSIKDCNCHPFINKNKTLVMAMNGTIRTLGNLAKNRDITDTELAFNMVNKKLIDIKDLAELSPKWIGFANGKVFAIPGECDRLKYNCENGAIMIASELKGESKTLGNEIWVEGEELKSANTIINNHYYMYQDIYDYYGFSKPYYKSQKPQKAQKKAKKKEQSKGIKNIEELSDEEFEDLKSILDLYERNMISLDYIQAEPTYQKLAGNWFTNNGKYYRLSVNLGIPMLLDSAGYPVKLI